MKKLFMVLSLVFLLCFTFSCQKGEDVAEKPVVDIAAEEATIMSFINAFDSAANAGDVDGLLALYMENAIMIPPNEPAIMGKEAIRAHFQKFFEHFTEEVNNTVEDFQVSGDLVFVRGAWTSIITPREGGESAKYNGNYVSVQKKQPDGSNMIICDIWSDESLVSPLTEKE